MLKRNGQSERHRVPHFTGRLTDAEHEAYEAAVGFVQPELADLATIASALRGIENEGMEAVEAVGTEMVTGQGERWQVRRCLVRLKDNDVSLCQRGTEFAIIERHPEHSVAAKANGQCEIISTGNHERQLLQDFVQNERQALQLLTSDLTAKASEKLTGQYPELNCQRVVQAIAQRCAQETNPKPAQAQTITPPRAAPTRGVKV